MLFRSLPPISDTERDTIAAGSTWWERDLFSGAPDWKKLLAFPAEPTDPTRPLYRSSRLTPLVIGRGRDDREQRERERLVRALAQAKGNKAEAARALGVARSTLLSRLKKHGLG